ncbi:MAG TPA: D-alanine--D-alanine ligase family protein [Candidatus Paceibacterota bacterium]|nr:D-alanine--D-alanine ligase family protein [Candidatus Paceibacterota bacterium]
MNIGVFFGSRSPEHDVSIITAQFIIAGLKGLGHTVTPVYIGRNGLWYVSDSLGDIKMFQTDHDLSHFHNYVLDLEESKGKMVLKKKGLFGKKIVIDLAFPALHGQNGEDGTIQGLFEMFNIPYVGCDVASSAIAMDKALTKQFYLGNKIETAAFLTFTSHEWDKHENEIIKQVKSKLDFPIFVKPARLGSSIGITKVNNNEELMEAINVALHYDDKVVVEEGIKNLADLTCAVLGGNEPKASLIQESLFDADFFNYEEKYLNDGGSQLGKAKHNLVIPAQINPEDTKKIEELSIKIYKLLGCWGTARVDYLYDRVSRKIYANEINPLPGTLYHHLWKASGIDFPELLKELIDLAFERHQEKGKLLSTFNSSILKKLNLANKLQLNKSR